MQDVGEFLMRYLFLFFKESDSSSDKRWATNTLQIRVKHEEVRVCSSNFCTIKDSKEKRATASAYMLVCKPGSAKILPAKL